MERSRSRAAVSCAIGAIGWSLLAAGSSHAATLVGPDFDAAILYDFDTTTGLASNSRPLSWRGVPVTGLVGLASGPGGNRFYALSSSQGSPWPAYLVTVRAVSGSVLPIGATGLAWLIEADLALDPVSGILYGIQDVGPSALQRNLFLIDTATGAATVIGDVDPGPLPGSDPPIVLPRDYSAMAFDAAGTLFVLDTAGARLLTVDKNDAAVLTNVTVSGAVLGDLAGMSFDPDGSGVLYVVNGGTGGTGTLYSLDPSTGVLSAVGPGLGGPTAIAGLVPEPGGRLLAWSALASLAVLGRCRNQCERASSSKGSSAQAPRASRA